MWIWIVIILLLFIGWLVWYWNGIQLNLTINCPTIRPVQYQPVPVQFDPISDAIIESSIQMSIAVTQSNCPDVPFNPPPGFKIVGRLGVPQLYGYVLNRPGQTIVVFTGTAVVNQWVADFKFGQVPWLNSLAKVHRGFFQIYMSFREELRRVILSNVEDQLIFTGISLGGALATLGAFDFSDYRPILISIASPRVGDPVFAEEFRRRVIRATRVFNSEDIVPTVPPPILGSLYYTHVGVDVGFTRNLLTYIRNHVEAYRDKSDFLRTIKNAPNI